LAALHFAGGLAASGPVEKRKVKMNSASASGRSSPKHSPVIAVLDHFFPQTLSSCRFEEFCCYLDEIPTLNIYSNGASLPLVDDTRSVEEVIALHLLDHPSQARRGHPALRLRSAKAKAAPRVCQRRDDLEAL
jgi:hypothetical protein